MVDTHGDPGTFSLEPSDTMPTRCLTLCLLGLTWPLATLTGQSRGIEPDRLAALRGRLQEFVRDRQIAGAVMLLARRDTVFFLEAVGYADLENRTPMRVDHIFRVASIAKPVTATAIMILQERGLLSVTDPVVRYLPEFASLARTDSTPPWRPPTLRQLLTHTGGLASEQQLTPEGAMQMSLSDVVSTYAKAPLAYRPGQRFLYSSPGFDMLGAVIERISGQPFETFMAEAVFRPLGMHDTGFFLTAERRQRLARFYHYGEGELLAGPRPNSYAGDLTHEGRLNPAPAYGLYTTASDLGALLRMMLNGGRYQGRQVLSPATVEAMTVDQIRRDGLPVWGLGWSVAQGSGRGPGGSLASARSFGHGGSTGVEVWADPERDLAGVFLIHQAGDLQSFRALEAFRNMAFAAVTDRSIH